MDSLDLTQRMSVAAVKAVAGRLHGDGAGVASLVEVLLGPGEARVRMNAAWILTHLAMDDKMKFVGLYRDRLMELAMGNAPVRRGLIMSLLLDLPDAGDVRVDFLDYCLEHICDSKEADSSRAVMIYVAARMCAGYPELMSELRQVLEMLPPDVHASVRCARRRVMVDFAG